MPRDLAPYPSSTNSLNVFLCNECSNLFTLSQKTLIESAAFVIPQGLFSFTFKHNNYYKTKHQLKLLHYLAIGSIPHILFQGSKQANSVRYRNDDFPSLQNTNTIYQEKNVTRSDRCLDGWVLWGLRKILEWWVSAGGWCRGEKKNHPDLFIW